MENLVFRTERWNPVTNSLLVAEKFNKRHSDILRAINDLISKVPENQCKRNFATITPRDILMPNGGTYNSGLPQLSVK